ncbi:MAG TPA: hypothetical protein PLU39_12640 [Armatimonadota bacterium]|jgi:membrane protein implicated in regulation of membrane protease activity|nr:hypothetical protein [Armatimonadota bacterium]HOJ20149.1 hypothetical protein [Armatimonadota bacterium]HOM82830.1 hypothetical protein [Armatimonadota bacterium]HPO73390.1 hypothetical protein [Armatimonadota bacterium]HPT98707.1 hypothetical protein [Armatimonadota bacterium]
MDLYIFASIGIFGSLLIVLSFVLGEIGHIGGGVDLDHDVAINGGVDHDLPASDAPEADVSAGHDAPGPLSVRVLSIFLSAFGLVGAASRLSGLHTSTSAALGVAAGTVLGWAAWRLMAFLWSQGGSSEVRVRDLEGRMGEVTVAIPAVGPGQVACVVDDVRVYQIARSLAGEEIPIGSRVRITEATPEGVLVERLGE